jgi:RimJ/RimL family protein N-acetyltransferase
MRNDLEKIPGCRLCLRLVTPEDAAYIHGLRVNPAYNTFLSPVTGSVADQRRWIEDYRARERAGLEYYYIIERLDGVLCGVVRLYDIRDDQFTWGSWILDHNKPAKAALESVLLSFGVGFEVLGLEKACFDVRRENSHAIAFYRRFGATETGTDDENIYFEYPRDRFAQNRDHYSSIINGIVSEPR